MFNSCSSRPLGSRESSVQDGVKQLAAEEFPFHNATSPPTSEHGNHLDGTMQQLARYAQTQT